MNSIKQFLSKRLRLKVNEAKSAVAYASGRKFLGYSFNSNGQLKVAPQSLDKFKNKIRELTKRNKGRSLESVIFKLNQYLNGWISYFRLSMNKSDFMNLDSWIRRRLRCYRLKQCKRERLIIKYLIKLGVKQQMRRI
jgi:RNA-directed DNA polymerase